MKKNHPVIIDSLSVRLPRGWQGDPVYLARKISEQIQHQAATMQSTKSMSLIARGHFSGNANLAASQLMKPSSSHTENKHTIKRANDD